MTTAARLNIFQRLMRRWDQVHPYNAAQIMKLRGSPTMPVIESAWRSALQDTGLGAVTLDKNWYQFAPLNGQAAGPLVCQPGLTLCEHVSAEMDRPFDDPLEAPFRPFVIVGEGHFYAGVVYQHWLADSASIRMLMREWFVRMFFPEQASRHRLRLPRAGYWDAVGPARGGWEVTSSVLDMTRRHIRMRKVQKIGSANLHDYRTRFVLMPGRPGLIDHVKAVAKSRGVKVNDLFLAALMEACAAHVPLQLRKNRRDVAVGSVVDLRPHSRLDLSDTFGLYLGFTNVICQRDELKNFDRIVQSVARQTQWQKQNGVAPASLMWMCAAWVVGMLSKPGELYHFYRKELPLAGGISNVDLTRQWMGQYPELMQDYIRVSPNGPMTPLVITTTTLSGQFHIGLTHRVGLITPENAKAVGEMFLDRLAK